MKKILFVGAGNMGGAILEAAVRAKVLDPQSTFVVDQDEKKVQKFQQELGIQSGNPGDCDAVLLAVKPQSFEQVFPLKTAANPLVISIMAGIPVQKISSISGFSRVCRVMPNTPALVNAGVSALFFTSAVEEADRVACVNIFESCGVSIEVDNEDQMHAITALSGSGPAYFFQFVEHLTTAGSALGLPKEMAEVLAEQTFFGAAELLRESPDSPAELRKKVTSPGGTTQAALEAFDDEGFDILVRNALAAAETRSRELGE